MLFFTVEVERLYPNVPRAEARQACRESLDQRMNPTIPTEKILEMIDVLVNNNFQFGDQNSTQKEGTAIRSRLGHALCIYIHGEVGIGI